MSIYIPDDPAAAVTRIFVAASASDTLLGGMVLKEDVSQSAVIDRATKVTQCNFANLHARTYIVDPRSSGAEDGDEITCWPVDDMLLPGLQVRTDEPTVSAGDFFGCKVSSYYATVGAVMDGKPFAKALAAGTIGSAASFAVQCNVGPHSYFKVDYEAAMQVLDVRGPTFIKDQWLVTKVDGGGDAAEVFDYAGTTAGLLVTTNDASADHVQFQHRGLTISVASGKNAYAVFKSVVIADGANSNMILGFAPYGSNSNDWYAANSAAGPDDAIMFRMDNDNNLDIRVAKNATSTASTAAAVFSWTNGDTYDLHVAKLGSQVKFWYRKSTETTPTLAATYTANIPDDVTLTIGGQHETANTAAETISIKSIFAVGASA